MLLPDMFDEKVALMGLEGDLSESGATEQGRLIALTPGQMVTLFTTGPEGRAMLAPMEVVLDDAKGVIQRAKSTAAGGKHYQSGRFILHTAVNSDYKRPQPTEKPREREVAGEIKARVLPSFTSNAVRRKPWALGIASLQALPPPVLPRTVSTKVSMPSGTDTLEANTERRLDGDDVNSDGGVDGDDENDRIEKASEIGWFGGMTRWASKLWSTRRVERPNTPRARE